MPDIIVPTYARLVISADQILASIEAYGERRHAQNNQYTTCSLEEFAARARPLLERGLTRGQIGHRLRLSESAVAGRMLRARRAGLLPPRGTQDRSQTAVAERRAQRVPHAEFIRQWRDQHETAA